MRTRNERTLNVLVVDDDPAVRRGLALILRSEPGVRVVGEAGDGAGAIEQIERLEPDIVLMDLRMPRLDGLRATRRIKATRPDLRVIILSVYADNADAALAAGADRFLLKDSSVEELIGAIFAGSQRLEARDQGNGKEAGRKSGAGSNPLGKKGDI